MGAASLGDTVLVAPGRYADSEVRVVVLHEPIALRSCAFLEDGVTLLSEGGPSETTLDLDGLGSDTSAAVVLALGLDSGQTVLEGFTIRGAALGGQGLRAWFSELVSVRNCVFEDLDGTPRGDGGGIACFRSTLEAQGCWFLRCFGWGINGGGLHAHETNVVVDGCSFVECDVGIQANAVTGSNSVVVRNSRFERNTQAGIRKGPQMHTAIIEACWFEGNTSEDGLQALSIYSGPVTVRNCVFVNNTSADDCAAIWCQAAGSAVLAGNTFWNNRNLDDGASHAAAVLIASGGNVQFTNNLIAGSAGAAALRVFQTNVTDSCNLFWNNADGDVLGITLDPTTVFADPDFCDADGGDLTVANGSPCVTTDGCGQIGALGSGCTTVSIENESWATIKGRFLR
jgi:hypothetical protein